MVRGPVDLCGLLKACRQQQYRERVNLLGELELDTLVDAMGHVDVEPDTHQQPLAGRRLQRRTTCMFSKNCSSAGVAGATSTVADFIDGGSVGEVTVALPPGATVVSIDDGKFA